MIILTTPRLNLRPVQPSDRADLHQLEQDPEVMRYLNGGLPTPLEPVAPETSSYLMPRGSEPEVWAVVERESGRFAGWVALFDDGATAELGYRLSRDFWGKGYAVEAARAVVSDAFLRTGVARIRAVTMAVNTRSRRVMETLGMQQVATRFGEWSDPIAGSKYGDVDYVIEREHWRQ